VAPACRRIAIVMTALALLPAVLPYDHLLPGLHIEDQAEESVHASHCHVEPGSCSDVPLASGFGEFVFNEPLVAIPRCSPSSSSRRLRSCAARRRARSTPPEALAAA